MAITWTGTPCQSCPEMSYQLTVNMTMSAYLPDAGVLAMVGMRPYTTMSSALPLPVPV